MASSNARDELRRLIDHVFLPPQLPQQEDTPDDSSVLEHVSDALDEFRSIIGASSVAMSRSKALIQTMRTIHSSNGAIDKMRLASVLVALQDGESTAIKVSAQNAALLITRDDTHLIFESFELSADNESVQTARGRLIRDFPANAIAIKLSLLFTADFTNMLTKTLSTMSQQSVAEMQPQSKKSGTSHEEDRNSSRPAVVSELLMGILRGIGTPRDTSSVRKHTREEVLWSDARKPWRRSATWLLVRVALQLTISRSPDGSPALYKNAMVVMMCRLLSSSHQLELTSELLYVMNAKIDRRRQKLLHAASLREAVAAHAESVLQATHAIISQRWALVQAQDSNVASMDALSKLEMATETSIALPDLEKHIAATQSHRDPQDTKQYQSTNGLFGISGKTQPLPKPWDAYSVQNLQLFEQWVTGELRTWQQLAQTNPNAVCKQLCRLIKEYHAVAVKIYSENPEGLSIMLLIIMELWTACDGAATGTCSLLKEYRAGISPAVMQNLLLPLLDQMKRLSQVEKHLGSRSQGHYSSASIFDLDSTRGFPNRFYNSSQMHKDLQQKILDLARTARQAKLTELSKAKLEYDRLNKLYLDAECEYITKVVDSWCDPPEVEITHKHSCKKCAYVQQRDALEIQIHEWPLPAQSAKANAVVFELVVPEWFVHWRDARFHILHNVLKGRASVLRPHTSYYLASDTHLIRHYGSTINRVKLLSDTKPAIVTHYNTKKISSATESNVCVPNGLNYRYYDSDSESYVDSGFACTDEMSLACTYKLSGDSRVFQRFIFRDEFAPDGEAPNAVIASQDACPSNTALDEYKELPTIPLGRHLQWFNILIQLEAPIVDLKKLETTLVVLQCINQTGPRSNDDDSLRESHHIMKDNTRAAAIIKKLDTALCRVKENWESVNALATFVAIAARVLSLNESVRESCFKFLRAARCVAAEWILDLREKAYLAKNDHSNRTRFVSKSIEIALICISTFDVEDQYLNTVMQGKDAHHLIWASIAAQEGENNQVFNEPHVARLRLRSKRLLLRSFSILSQNGAALDVAVKEAWSGYIPGRSGWSNVAKHWITTQTATAAYVHYNLLNGELLVNGLPLDQPPANYREPALFRTLFGDATVEVMPASTPGFQFSTKRSFGGCAVDLGMISGQLIVRATTEARTYETMPTDAFRSKYPRHFTNDYVFWYDSTNKDVKLLPKEDPWNFNHSSQWRFSRNMAESGWQLSRDGTRVLSTVSKTAAMLSSILKPFAEVQDIHCLLLPGDTLLQAEIPLLRLSFTLQKGERLLRSREHRAMFIDEDQSLGALVGFRNKIMLRHHQNTERIALILESGLQYSKHGFHVEVEVTDKTKANVHIVKVDRTLQRLLDSQDLEGKLYLAYLHALTSHCLPDPATLCTGTEQSLRILRSKAVESFNQLSQENVAMLTKIGRLSPGRQFYPKHMRVMQSVQWNKKLPFLSQHDEFHMEVARLLCQSRASKLFHPEIKLQINLRQDVDEHLQARASMRSCAYRVSGFGAENHDPSHDETYVRRDQGLESSRATNVTEMAKLLSRDGDARHWKASQAYTLWALMTDQQTISGAQTKFDTADLCFDASLLKEKAIGPIMAQLPPLHRLLTSSQTGEKHQFSIMTWLCSLSFASDAQLDTLQLIAMCTKAEQLEPIKAPAALSFRASQGYAFKFDKIKQFLSSHLRASNTSPEWSAPRQPNEKKKDYDRRREAAWKRAKDAVVQRTVASFKSQWPCATAIEAQVEGLSTYIDIDRAMPLIKDAFNVWYNNSLLHAWLSELTMTLNSLPVSRISMSALQPRNVLSQPTSSGFVSEDDLFSKPAPALPRKPRAVLAAEDPSAMSPHTSPEPRLRGLITKMKSNGNQSKYELDYVRDLAQSLQALRSKQMTYVNTTDIQEQRLSAYLDECRNYVEDLFQTIVCAFTSLAKEKTAYEIAHTPRVSPSFLLQQLSRHRWSKISVEWKKCIVEYVLAVTALQRATRLLRLAQSNRHEDVINELDNVGHVNWDPFEFPETLLMEAESGIMVRQVQEEIAGQMRQPSSDCNAVMQLNMGEGKSSVIVPIVGAYLANGSQLARVIVAKPQSKQMAQMLISKIGGLVARRVYYLPYARAIQPSRSDMEAISAMLENCMSEGGILLMQPEHILSFKLMVPETLIDGAENVAQSAIAAQRFLDTHARDIVDESDENFSPRFELVYTMGTQRSIESSPGRWLLIGQVLELARRTFPVVAENFPSSIETVPGIPGAFPRTRILRDDAAKFFVQELATKVCSEGLEGFHMSRQPPGIREAVLTYITKDDLSAPEINLVEESATLWTETFRPQLLLLRGLLAEGVLVFALSQKRWRVNYGLADRNPPTKVAVPFRAKDTPALRSEFSHPEVIITLTLLSYYYQGLDDTELFAALAHLMNSDQAEITYQDWVKDSNGLEEAFRTLKGINTKDRLQCINKVFPALKYGKRVVDYYIAHLVFPKEMKEFPHKLSASGWDIGKARERLTTGFSGTIDSRHLLPLEVTYLELPDQKHTNALVMEHLLQPENGVQIMDSTPANHSVSDADHLLSCVMQLNPPVQVVLDVGAQILELDNLELAKAWLKSHDNSKEAVVFIDQNDEICVVDREGRVDLLLASTYQSRLDACLVFLDEAHTRGIDLVLPIDYRAAVTLGPRLTKDRLVQACMRLRKLGKGQTVVFCVSQEIQDKIFEAAQITSDSAITVADILEWSMRETLDDLRRNMPLWAVQGERFVRQEKIWGAANKRDGKMNKGYAEKLLENEAQSLEDRYCPCLSSDGPKIFALSDDPTVQQIATRCKGFDITQFKASALQEEQERELSP